MNQGKPAAAPEEPVADLRTALVVSRFNSAITDKLATGARSALTKAGVVPEHIETFTVPGAFELPATALRLARSKRYDAVIPIGAVIRGETDHYQYICQAVTEGLTRLAYDAEQWGVAVAFGVLTTESLAQAEARAGGTDGNKGEDAARAALEVCRLWRAIHHAAGGGKYGFR